MVSGSLRATDTLYSTAAQFQILKIPTESNGTTYGPGTSGQILKSNGTSVYWATTLGIDHGGTGATNATGARTNLGLGTIATETATNYLKWQITSIADSTTLYDFGVYVKRGSADTSTTPSGNAYYNILNIPYRKASGNTTPDYAFSIGSSAESDNRLFFRTSGASTYGAWQEVAHAPVGSSNIGSATQPVYMTKTGVITAGTALKNLAYKDSLTASDIPDISDTYLKLTGGTLTGNLISQKFLHPTITGTGTAAVAYNASTSTNGKPALWKFNLSTAVPSEGDIITITIPIAGHANGVFISTDNGTTYKPVSVSGTSRLTTHYGAGTTISLVYDADGSTNTVYPVNGGTATTNITGGCWRVINYYDSGNSTDRLYSAAGASRTAETSANGGIGLFRYSLQLMTTNQTWSSIACVNGSTDASQGTTTSKMSATANFLLNSPILYSDTNVRVAPGSSSNVNGYTAMPIDIRYNTSGTVSLTIQKPVYLVGTANSDGATFKLLSANWWTQTLPTTNDGNIYIFLGLASSATNIYLTPYHPIYYHNGTTIMPYTPGIVGITNGGTGATTAAGARTNLGLGNAATYSVDDATANGALGTGTGLTTERSVYYGLVTVNNASQTRATGIYAPTSAGTANQILVSAGGTSAPTWKATASGAAYATSENGSLTFGTLPVAQGGTGQTSVANIQAGKDGDGNTISSTYAKLAVENRFTAITNRFCKIILEAQTGAYLSFGILNNTQGFPDYDNFIQIQPFLSSTDASLTFSISNTNSDKTQWKTERFSLPSVEIGTSGGNYDILTTKNTVTVAQGGTNITSYTIGDILYASGSTALSKLNGNTTTTRKFLTSVATTSGTAVAPQWDTVTKTDVGLSNVENTKLSTWTGSTNITTLGTINSGTWQGTTIAASYIGNHSTDKLTSGTLPIARGGTGATSAADARANLTAVKYIKLTSTNTDTWAHLWTELNEITTAEVANFTTTIPSATQKITGGKITQNLLHGTIVRTNTTEFRIGAAMPATGSYVFFTLTFDESNHGSCTVGTVYRAQGTAM